MSTAPAAPAPGIDPTHPIRPEDLPGGRYQYVDNMDGTFNVLDVPILAELPANTFPAPVNREPIDAEWMEAAIAKARQRESEGHYGAVHVHHHGDGEVAEAGMLRLSRVGRVVYDGKERSALYADFLRVPRAVFDEMKAGRLRYRSIEGGRWENREITSIALMPTETPYWRLPMLTIGGRVESNILKMRAECRPAIACAVSDTAFRILTHDSGELVMAVNQMPPMPGQAQAQGQPAAPAQPQPDNEGGRNLASKIMGLVMGMMSSLVAECEKLMTGGPKGKEEADMAEKDKDETESKAKMVSKPHEQEEALAQASAKTAEQVQAVEDAAAKAAAAIAAKDVQIAELQAQVDALKAKMEAKGKADAVAEKVTAAEKDLAGFTITDQIRSTLKTMAETGDAVLAAYVASIKAALPKAAPASPEETVASAKPGADEEAIGKLGALDPKALARARELAPLGRAYISAVRTDTTLEDYIRCNLRREGFAIPKA